MAKILVVDDSQFVRMRMKKLLNREGYTVVEAEDGFAAILAYERSQPDLVLLDITMPGKTGLEALADIRANDDEAKVIMLTAIDQEEAVVEAMRLGALDYLPKQQDPQQLMITLKKILGE
ncbi:MAG TPA: response regulator [Anaerolineae bacterium]|nr:response regulator [Anaerolineae bacterium]